MHETLPEGGPQQEQQKQDAQPPSSDLKHSTAGGVQILATAATAPLTSPSITDDSKVQQACTAACECP